MASLLAHSRTLMALRGGSGSAPQPFLGPGPVLVSNSGAGSNVTSGAALVAGAGSGSGLRCTIPFAVSRQNAACEGSRRAAGQQQRRSSKSRDQRERRQQCGRTWQSNCFALGRCSTFAPESCQGPSHVFGPRGADGGVQPTLPRGPALTPVMASSRTRTEAQSARQSRGGLCSKYEQGIASRWPCMISAGSYRHCLVLKTNALEIDNSNLSGLCLSLAPGTGLGSCWRPRWRESARHSLMSARTCVSRGVSARVTASLLLSAPLPVITLSPSPMLRQPERDRQAGQGGRAKGLLLITAAGRSRGPGRTAPKPKVRRRAKVALDRPNLMRRGRRREVRPEEAARKLLESPQLSPESMSINPLAAACLSPLPMTPSDRQWMADNLDEVKDALGLLAVGDEDGEYGNECEEDDEEEEDGVEGEEEEEGDGDDSYFEEGEEHEAQGSGTLRSTDTISNRGGGAVDAASELRSHVVTIGGSRLGLQRTTAAVPSLQSSGLTDRNRHRNSSSSSSSSRELLDQLLYLSFMHRDQPRRPRHVKVAGSRLAFLGGHVLELALAEFFLQRHPRETPASLRERVMALTNRRRLPAYLTHAGLDRLVFAFEDDRDRNGSVAEEADESAGKIERLPGQFRIPAAKAVFNALVATAYLTGGMAEVYRLLFEVFGFAPDASDAQPKLLRTRDDDYLWEELERAEGHMLSWRELAAYEPAAGSLFGSCQRLHAACVPPGMDRFRGCDWMRDSLADVLTVLEWPRPAQLGDSVETKQQRNERMVLTLLLAFMHPSLHKQLHPRFCYERLEYLGQKIQAVVLAERLLQEHLDAPILWLDDRHGSVTRNRSCAKRLKDKRLDRHLWISSSAAVQSQWDANRKMRSAAFGAAYCAVHGAAYAVYGKAEVERLLFGVWGVEGGWLSHLDGGVGVEVSGPTMEDLLGRGVGAAGQALAGFTSRA